MDDEGSAASDSDVATVTYDNVAPAIAIAKTVDVDNNGTFTESESVDEGTASQTADYQYVVTNESTTSDCAPKTLPKRRNYKCFAIS